MLTDYYPDPFVRARLIDFLGGESLEQSTSVYITSNGHADPQWYNPRPVSDLWQCFDGRSELGRSLCDRKSLIAHLDIEYVNFDRPAEPYVDPTRAFALQRPVIESIEEVLLQQGIAPLHLLSGRGHHFVWQIGCKSAAAGLLSRIGRMPDTLRARYAQPQPPTGESVSSETGMAFAGLGMVMEFVAHRVSELAEPKCDIAVELTAVEAGPRNRGREIISIDLSEYGDPLYTRSIRLPYSPYLKHHWLRGVLNEKLVEHLPALFVFPVQEMDDQQGLHVMRHVDEVAKLARRATAQIPDQSHGMEKLISAYLGSELSRFHDYFYCTEHDSPERWPATYDRTPLEALPPCARRLFSVERAGKLIQDYQLEPYSFHAPFADHIDITSPDANTRNPAVQEILRAADAAALIGARHFVIHPGPERGDFPCDERLRRMENAATALNHISSQCKQLGIRLVLENMLPHLFFGHTRDVFWILGALEAVDVGICLDTGHAHLSGDLGTVAHKLSGHLWMVHASDNHGHYDDHLPPGEGNIAWQPFMDQLDRLHFSGTFILEIAGDLNISAVLERAQRATRFLQDISRNRASNG